ncbi:MAG: L,D-transpeptidase family protein [Longimicrobiales bacterium]
MPDHASGSGSVSRLVARVGIAILTVVVIPGVTYARQGREQSDPTVTTTAAAEVRDEALDFLAAQLAHPRVMEARLQARFEIKRMFRERGISYPASELFIRVFKRERLLELWVRPSSEDEFVLLRQYMVCALRGDLGPKRIQGDRQTPEGFYEIDRFNPNSAFHLALQVNYPNRSDRLAGRSRGTAALGGEIMIHGGCQTEGCIAVTNEAIKEIYWIAVETRVTGQEHIPVHIFPARLTNEDLTLLAERHQGQPWLVAFWTSLKPGYDYFERTHRLPPIRVDETGHYLLLGQSETDRG